MKKLNNKIKFFAFIIISMISVNCLIVFPSVMAFPWKENLYTDITVEEAAIMMKKTNKYPNLIILDVRTKEEFETSHLFGAINIPLDEIEENIYELENYQNDEIIVYCKVGSRSINASILLGANRFSRVFNMIGGIDSWVEKDYLIWALVHEISITKSKISIVPYILEPMDIENCPCSEDNSCSDVQSNSYFTINIIEENSINFVQELLIFENNTQIESFIINTTTLFKEEVITSSEIRKTVIIQVEIYKIDVVVSKYLELACTIQKKNDYNMSINTFLTPGQDNNFEKSETLINFKPIDQTYTTLEEIKFNSNDLKLSTIYSKLAKVSNKLSKVYNKQQMPEFKVNYEKIANELKLLSQFVKIECEQYNLEIYDSQATIADNWWEEKACLWISSYLEINPFLAHLIPAVAITLIGAVAAIAGVAFGIIVSIILSACWIYFSLQPKSVRDAWCRANY